VPILLYRTLPIAPEVKEGAVVLGLALKAALKSPESLARAGFGGAPLEAAGKLFDAVLGSPSGVVFAVDEWAPPLRTLQLALDDMLAELGRLDALPEARDAAFPFVLSAGERRSFTANTIIRDPEWRKKDAQGALRVSPADAASLGVSDGERVKLTTRRQSVIVPVEVSDTMQPGHVSLPNGLGLSYPVDGRGTTTGVPPNELTATEDRDPFVGTPWHKHVPARVERLES
jgi:anaerobic selenocysteine-containing dehydrogenase